jgi:hypothetical protein
VGGTAPYSYTNPSGLITIPNPTGIYTNTTGSFRQAAGSVTYTVTDAMGCTSTTTVNLTQPTQVVVNATANNVSCNGGNNGSVSITSITGGTPSAPNTYTVSWTGPGTFTSTSRNITGLVAGVYRYTVTDSKGCSVSADITVGQPNPIVVSETHTDVTCLIGGISTVTIKATGGTPDLTFSSPTGYKFTATGTAQLTASLTSGIFQQVPLTTLIYTVKDKNGCSGTLSLNIVPGDMTAPSFTRPTDKTIPYAQGSSCFNALPSITGDVTNETDAVWSGLQATYTDAVYPCGFSTIIRRTWSLEDGCKNKAPDQLQTITVTDNSTPYILFAKTEAKFGQSNLINGSVGVSSISGKASFGSNSKLLSPNFVKAANITVSSGAIVNTQTRAAATDGPNPIFYPFTGSTQSLGNFTVSNSTAVPVSGNYKKLTIKKNVTVTVSGTLYGRIQIESGAQVTFNSPSGIINVETLKILGSKSATTKVKFNTCTSVRIKDKVDVAEYVEVNTGGPNVTFYLGDDKKDEEKFIVHGGKTKVAANIFIRDGKLKISGGDRDRNDGDRDCEGEERDRNEYNSDTTYMTGWFIAEKIESDGKNVVWGKNSCILPSLRSVQGVAVTNKSEKGNHFEIKVLPNPSTTNFRLLVETFSNDPVQIRLLDATGKAVGVYSDVSPYSIIKVGDKLMRGIYFAELTQGEQRKVVKLIKL